jgi:inorganic pyrophosphatase
MKNVLLLLGIKPSYLDCPAYILITVVVNLQHVAAKLHSKFRETYSKIEKEGKWAKHEPYE